MTEAGAASEACFACGKPVVEDDDRQLDVDALIVDDDRRVVLVLGNRRRIFCSEACLGRTLRRERTVRATALRRWAVGLAAVAVLVVGSRVLWRRHRAPPPQWISFGSSEDIVLADAVPTGPVPLGPNWPPTDADWMAAFEKASWVFPLPGPVRRIGHVDGRIYGPQPPRDQRPLCRRDGDCAVDIGGELWGEHVYAALDGVIERVDRNGKDTPGGQYVRLAHFGGMVFTQYFHLAGTPRGIVTGARVKGGDVIGLLGDTGTDCPRRHLHFTLSVRPAKRFSEVYWDPRPLMEGWSVRTPTYGSVAGLASVERKTDTPRRRVSR